MNISYFENAVPLDAMRLSLAFAIIAGIMALYSLEVGVNRGPVVEAFNGAPICPGQPCQG